MTEQLPLNTRPMPIRLRIEDFVLLDQSGAFDKYAKTELVEGEILFINAQHRPHGMVKMELYDALRDALRSLRSPLRPVIEFSVVLPPDSMPEPDIMLTSQPRGEGPVPLASVALVIEVSDHSLDFDLGAKARIYAAAGIPEYGVADLNARLIHQMWAPEGKEYSERRKVAFAGPVEAVTIAGIALDTSSI